MHHNEKPPAINSDERIIYSLRVTPVFTKQEFKKWEKNHGGEPPTIADAIRIAGRVGAGSKELECVLNPNNVEKVKAVLKASKNRDYRFFFPNVVRKPEDTPSWAGRTPSVLFVDWSFDNSRTGDRLDGYWTNSSSEWGPMCRLVLVEKN